ncbi:hypothetical protein GI584_21565 [Gracilibacillus salitolerans]|uniref:Uncharacterized protein n=1 Tax=Gracilibacillus salitolerans TaxID=2663022 RepID=A0A5Q2TQW8_9BACI|nr:hypothetical protein [Gracilibacillus salitolerans]QGH36477.1 hypothetical protein GI584_21565 [Gracilibacillus salitolerans]
MKYKEYWDQIYEKNEELNSIISSYWSNYSDMGTWQFWVVVSLLIFPLFLLYFTVDRKRMFELFFFGYTVHMLWTYVDIILERYGYFVHTYFLTPVLPMALNMTASALPVGFLLIYQYCTNNKKNFYLYTIILSVVFAFGFASLEAHFGLLKFNKGMNQFYVFLIDIVIAFISFWFTKFIRRIVNMPK